MQCHQEWKFQVEMAGKMMSMNSERYHVGWWYEWQAVICSIGWIRRICRNASPPQSSQIISDSDGKWWCNVWPQHMKSRSLIDTRSAHLLVNSYHFTSITRQTASYSFFYSSMRSLSHITHMTCYHNWSHQFISFHPPSSPFLGSEVKLSVKELLVVW